MQTVRTCVAVGSFFVSAAMLALTLYYRSHLPHAEVAPPQADLVSIPLDGEYPYYCNVYVDVTDGPLVDASLVVRLGLPRRVGTKGIEQRMPTRIDVAGGHYECPKFVGGTHPGNARVAYQYVALEAVLPRIPGQGRVGATEDEHGEIGAARAE